MIFVVSVFIKKEKKREEMCNRYQAHTVYYYYACMKFYVTYNVIWRLPALKNETDFLLL